MECKTYVYRVACPLILTRAAAYSPPVTGVNSVLHNVGHQDVRNLTYAIQANPIVGCGTITLLQMSVLNVLNIELYPVWTRLLLTTISMGAMTAPIPSVLLWVSPTTDHLPSVLLWVAPAADHLRVVGQDFDEDEQEADERADTDCDCDGEGPRQLAHVVPTSRLLITEVLRVAGAVHRHSDHVEDGCKYNIHSVTLELQGSK